MDNKPSYQSQYSLIIDILSEMVTNYLFQNSENSNENSRGSGRDEY